MDKSKLLNLFLFAFIFSIAVQYFFAPDKSTETPIQDVMLEIKDDSITIPNIPHIEAVNSTTGSFTVNPCTDITISIDSRPLVGMSGSTPDFCAPLEILA